MANEKQSNVPQANVPRLNTNSFLSPAINAGSNLIGAGLQQLFYRQNARFNQKLQQENLKYQWENAIPETVNSMRQAGLNVGLAYSNGGPSPSTSMGAGSVPVPANPLTGVGELALEAQFKKEQIEAMKIENEFRAERLKNENALSAQKVETEKTIQMLNEATTNEKESIRGYYDKLASFQQIMNDRERDISPAIISQEYQKFSNLLAEGQKLDIENSQLRFKFAVTVSHMLKEMWLWHKMGNYYSETASVNRDSFEYSKTRHEDDVKIRTAYNDLQKAHQEYLNDMSSSQKFKNYMSAAHALASVISAGADVYKLGKGSQLPPVNTSQMDNFPTFDSSTTW